MGYQTILIKKRRRFSSVVSRRGVLGADHLGTLGVEVLRARRRIAGTSRPNGDSLVLTSQTDLCGLT